MRRQQFRLSDVCLLLAGLTALCGAQQQGVSESQVKAAYLLNFTKFVEWPATAFEDARSPLTICVLAPDDPFGGALDQMVEGEAVNGHRLAVQRIRHPLPPKSCQVMYIDKSEKDVHAIVVALGPGVLTVSDKEGFIHEGGIIAFVLQDRRVRFDINQRASSKAMLAVSARLLSVARSVLK